MLKERQCASIYKLCCVGPGRGLGIAVFLKFSKCPVERPSRRLAPPGQYSGPFPDLSIQHDSLCISAHFPTTSWIAPLSSLVAECHMIYEWDCSVAGTRKPRLTIASFSHTCVSDTDEPLDTTFRSFLCLTPPHFLHHHGCPGAIALVPPPNQAVACDTI